MTTISTDPIVQVLERYWGFREFRPWQREAIDTILERRDSVLVLPTGGGKSLCFQAPALVDDGTAGPRLALVVSPLIALMKDQVDGLVASGVPAACLNSAQPAEERSAAMSMVRSGACRLLYVSPERLVGDGAESFREWVGRVGVRFVAIDEAHCISQWGHDFRPEYRLLGRLKHDFPARVDPRVHRDGHRARARRHGRAARAARSGRARRPLRPPEPHVPRGAAHRDAAADAEGARPASPARRESSTACPAARSTRRRRGCRGWAYGRSPYHAGHERRGAPREPGGVHRRARRRRRGHGGVRHGHRPPGRPVRGPRRLAAIARALPAGVRTRRPRRPACRVRPHCVAGRLPAVEEPSRD